MNFGVGGLGEQSAGAGCELFQPTSRRGVDAAVKAYLDRYYNVDQLGGAGSATRRGRTASRSPSGCEQRDDNVRLKGALSSAAVSRAGVRVIAAVPAWQGECRKTANLARIQDRPWQGPVPSRVQARERAQVTIVCSV